MDILESCVVYRAAQFAGASRRVKPAFQKAAL
jgi:hypothetical protein